MVVIKKRVAGRIVASTRHPVPAPQTIAPPVKSGLGRIQRIRGCRKCPYRYHLVVAIKICPSCGEPLRVMQ